MTLLLTFIQKAIGQGVAFFFWGYGAKVTQKKPKIKTRITGLILKCGLGGRVGGLFFLKNCFAC